MIEAAMLFALGAFVSGLVALASVAAVVRRTRRVTERRLRASLATRRAEYDTERDELRARHAMELRRLEQEASRLRDEATARRLEADIKDQELTAMRTDLEARTIEVEELTERLTQGNHTHIEAERRLAEARAALRTAEQAVSTEVQHRAALQALLEERQRELSALGVENERMRAALETERRLRELQASQAAAGTAGAGLPIPEPIGAHDAWATVGATIVPLPARETAALARLLAVDPAERTPKSETVEKIASELGRMAGEAHANPRTPCGGRRRARTAPGRPRSGPWRAASHRLSRTPRPLRRPGGRPDDQTAKSRFFEALEEIRSMKRAGGAPRPPNSRRGRRGPSPQSPA